MTITLSLVVLLAIGLFLVVRSADSGGADAGYTSPSSDGSVHGTQNVRAAEDDYPSQWRAPVPKDTVMDAWGNFNRESTSFVAWRLHARNGFEMPHGIGNAGDWGVWARVHHHSVNMTPAVGSAAWWTPSTAYTPWGNVAWVKSVNGNSVTVEEYNFNGSGNYHQRTIPARSVSGYIHFKDLAER